MDRGLVSLSSVSSVGGYSVSVVPPVPLRSQEIQ
jgi:hypothetical protein